MVFGKKKENDSFELREKIDNLENMYKALENAITKVTETLNIIVENQKEITNYIDGLKTLQIPERKTSNTKRSTKSKSNYIPFCIDPYSHMGAILTIGKAYERGGRSGNEPIIYYRTLADLAAYLTLLLGGNPEATLGIAKIGYPISLVPVKTTKRRGKKRNTKRKKSK